MSAEATTVGGVEPRSGRGAHPILWFIVRRVGAGLATLLVVSMLIFASVQALPGDVAEVVLGRNATPEQVNTIRENLGLDDPLPSRYVQWLGNTLTGDFGQSTAAAAVGNEVDVWNQIRSPLLNSFVLAALTIVLLVPLSMFLGTLAAIRAGRPTDHAINTTSLSVAALPEFLVGTLLIALFFTALDVLPPISQTPFEAPVQFLLPVATLLAVNLAYVTRMVRATMIDVLHRPYVGMARLNGFSELRVVTQYALRNALAPSVQAIALTVQYLIGGVIIVESVFAYPGIGTELVQAVSARDIQVISIIAMILATIYITVNIVADVVVTLLVPKLRTEA